MRNEEFERKLEGALKQLDRRDKVIQDLGKLQEENSVAERKLSRLEKEQAREHSY